MSNLITGTHHIALKCASEEQFAKAVAFYHEILGMEIVRQWGEGEGQGIMLSTGNSLMEIFASGLVLDSAGAVNHIALATEDVDGCVAAVRAAGYEITVEEHDICIPSAVPFPARIAFCIGPVGEDIEFFSEK